MDFVSPWFEPRLLPENQARCIASSIRFAAAAEIFQVNPIEKPPSAGAVDRIAGLVRTFVDPEPPTAILEHLWHEWQTIQSTVLVEGAEDFLLASNFNPVARAQCHSRSFCTWFAYQEDSRH
jgi:hypothetical protein